MPAAKALSAVSASESDPKNLDRSFVARWKHKKLFDKGFVAIPSRFLQLYSRLKPFPLTHGEAIFVLHLMEFKWDQAAPFPGYKTIAARMGVSDKMVRRHAQSLETKKYLRRIKRIGQTNLFDLTGLFDALLRTADEAADSDKRQRAKAASNALTNWYARMVDAFKHLSPQDTKELADWERVNIGAPSSDWPGWERYLGPRPI